MRFSDRQRVLFRGLGKASAFVLGFVFLIAACEVVQATASPLPEYQHLEGEPLHKRTYVTLAIALYKAIDLAINFTTIATSCKALTEDAISGLSCVWAAATTLVVVGMSVTKVYRSRASIAKAVSTARNKVNHNWKRETDEELWDVLRGDLEPLLAGFPLGATFHSAPDIWFGGQHEWSGMQRRIMFHVNSTLGEHYMIPLGFSDHGNPILRLSQPLNPLQKRQNVGGEAFDEGGLDASYCSGPDYDTFDEQELFDAEFPEISGAMNGHQDQSGFYFSVTNGRDQNFEERGAVAPCSPADHSSAIAQMPACHGAPPSNSVTGTHEVI